MSNRWSNKYIKTLITANLFLVIHLLNSHFYSQNLTFWHINKSFIYLFYKGIAGTCLSFKKKINNHLII